MDREDLREAMVALAGMARECERFRAAPQRVGLVQADAEPGREVDERAEVEKRGAGEQRGRQVEACRGVRRSHRDGDVRVLRDAALTERE